jgi:hypothetical protein
MTSLLFIPALLSSLALAAHFYRNEQILLMFVFCALPVLLALRQRWATSLVQVILFAGALEWVRTLLQIAAVRQDKGEPWHRMAVILASVAAFTGISSMLLFVRRPGRHGSLGQMAILPVKSARSRCEDR